MLCKCWLLLTTSVWECVLPVMSICVVGFGWGHFGKLGLKRGCFNPNYYFYLWGTNCHQKNNYSLFRNGMLSSTFYYRNMSLPQHLANFNTSKNDVSTHSCNTVALSNSTNQQGLGNWIIPVFENTAPKREGMFFFHLLPCTPIFGCFLAYSAVCDKWWKADNFCEVSFFFFYFYFPVTFILSVKARVCSFIRDKIS